MRANLRTSGGCTDGVHDDRSDGHHAKTGADVDDEHLHGEPTDLTRLREVDENALLHASNAVRLVDLAYFNDLGLEEEKGEILGRDGQGNQEDDNPYARFRDAVNAVAVADFA